MGWSLIKILMHLIHVHKPFSAHVWNFLFCFFFFLFVFRLFFFRGGGRKCVINLANQQKEKKILPLRTLLPFPHPGIADGQGPSGSCVYTGQIACGQSMILKNTTQSASIDTLSPLFFNVIAYVITWDFIHALAALVQFIIDRM